MFDIVNWNYYFCHLLFGFSAPLVFGYMAIPSKNDVDVVPLRQFVRNVSAVPVSAWPGALYRSFRRDLASVKAGIPWSPWSGLLVTLFFSVGNEVFVDPIKNGIPFTSDYYHFVLDMIGLGSCMLLSNFVFRDRQGNTRTNYETETGVISSVP